MEIGLFIKQYRQNNDLTLREFAARCGTSHSYIAMLENNKNSKTGEPIVPTLTMLNKIAKGMGISVSDLISICDDMPVRLAPAKPVGKLNIQLFAANQNAPEEPKLTEGEEMWLELYHLLTDESKAMLCNTIPTLRSLPKEKQATAAQSFLQLLSSLQ